MITFIIIVVFSFLNALLSLFIYAHTKRNVYLQTGLFWAAQIVNFILQGEAQQGEFRIIMSFGFSLLPMYFLGTASFAFQNAKFPMRSYGVGVALAFLVTLLLKDLPISFTLKAMPFALAATYAPLSILYHYIRGKGVRRTALFNVYCVVLVFLAVHAIDFALFRMDPNSQIIGWSIAYGLYQVLAVLIPGLALDFTHREEQERLQNIIADRTRDLVQANAKLEQLFQQKDFLFKTLTHDISNPLMSIKAKIMMRDECLTNPAQLIDSVEAMTGRITNLIRQVRQVENFESHIASSPPVNLDVLECVRDVEILFAERLANKQLKLSYAATELSGLQIAVERGSFLTSVLPNLISNAIKFSHPGSAIQIRVSTRANGFISLSVEDTGTGISESRISGLFEFGKNTSSKGTGGEEGTGFGLPIVARIVRAYGGDLLVQSREEKAGQPGMTKMELVLPGARENIARAA